MEGVSLRDRAAFAAQSEQPAGTQPCTNTNQPAGAGGRQPVSAVALPSGRGPLPSTGDALRDALLGRVMPWSWPDSVADGGFPADASPGPCGDEWDEVDDPASAPPDGEYQWLALLPEPLLAEYSDATAASEGPETRKAGHWDRAAGDGVGFASGGVTDRMAPGGALAHFTENVLAAGLAHLSDDELVGVLRAARRLSSWSTAVELTAAADLMRRRMAEEAAGDAGVAEHAGDELAAALTMTSRAADKLLDRAMALGRLPRTMKALTEGDIDLPRAAVIVDELTGLDDFHAAIVEQIIAHDAPYQTTGELRAAARWAVLVADPAAALARKERAQREARVERWTEHAGTSALAGRDLPPAQALAADEHISALAGELRAAGLPGTMDELRAQVFLALLAGCDPATALPIQDPAAPPEAVPASQPPGSQPTEPIPGPPGATPNLSTPGASANSGIPATSPDPGTRAPAAGTAGGTPVAATNPGTQPGPRRERSGGISAKVNLTIPVTTWLGMSQLPGTAAGFGPLDASDSRRLAALIASNPRNQWCLTLTDDTGRAIAHGCARAGPPTSPRTDAPDGLHPPGCAIAWLSGIPVRPLATGTCDHRHQTPAYRPPAALRLLIEIRQNTCSSPGCRRPAARCDQDHTLAFDQGGISCECNLSPLCRSHHRAKQAHGWGLEQPQPGVMVWTTPSRRTYTTRPTSYPGEADLGR